jgi:hypothetical protein
MLISVRDEIVDAGYTVAEELDAPIAKLVECVAVLMPTHVLHLIRNRAFGEVRDFLKKLGHRPFLKRYLRRDEILSSITECDTALNDALGMFSVRLSCTSELGRPFFVVVTDARSFLLTALCPDPYPEAHPSQRAAKTERNTRSARINLAPFSQPSTHAPSLANHGAPIISRRPRKRAQIVARPTFGAERAGPRPRYGGPAPAHAHRALN